MKVSGRPDGGLGEWMVSTFQLPGCKCLVMAWAGHRQAPTLSAEYGSTLEHSLQYDQPNPESDRNIDEKDPFSSSNRVPLARSSLRCRVFVCLYRNLPHASPAACDRGIPHAKHGDRPPAIPGYKETLAGVRSLPETSIQA